MYAHNNLASHTNSKTTRRDMTVADYFLRCWRGALCFKLLRNQVTAGVNRLAEVLAYTGKL